MYSPSVFFKGGLMLHFLKALNEKTLDNRQYDTLPDQVYIWKSCVKKNDYELTKRHEVFIIVFYGSLYI